MKLVIDISSVEYELYKANYLPGNPKQFIKEMLEAIAQGTPLESMVNETRSDIDDQYHKAMKDYNINFADGLELAEMIMCKNFSAEEKSNKYS